MSRISRNAIDPAAVNRASVRARGDVVEHEFIRTFIAVPFAASVEDVAHNLVVAELHTLDDLTIAHIEAGDYALCKNCSISSSVRRPSRSALPVTTLVAPVAAR